MTGVPAVLGLREQEALDRLKTMGSEAVDICVSGRRREGTPRVIRQKEADDRVELVVSYFKELEIPPVAAATSPLNKGG